MLNKIDKMHSTTNRCRDWI